MLEVLPAVLMSPLSSADTPPSNLEASSGHQPLPHIPEASANITPVLFLSLPLRHQISSRLHSASEGFIYLLYLKSVT